MRTLKPNFTYVNVAFIFSLVVLTILSFLFYQRSSSHLRYSRQLDESYTVILELKLLEQRMTDMETYSRGYMLTHDSSFLKSFTNSWDSIDRSYNTLEVLFASKPDQMTKFQLLRSTIASQVNMYNRTNRNFTRMDSSEKESWVLKSRLLMDTFRTETKNIESGELRLRDELYANKNFYETVFPNYFSTILVWSGIVTLVSFYFIHREMGIRAKYQAELERKVQELNRSNNELEQFAYIASHDLQEPMRKIRTFTDKLKFKFTDEMPGDLRLVIDRIEAAAKRMQELIHDMINFTGLIGDDEQRDAVDLNQVLRRVLNDFVDIAKSRNAEISWDQLPVIKGDERQLKLLFSSIIDNSFKFAKTGEPPVIRINYALVDGNNETDETLKGRYFHKVVVEDNGIGFNNDFSEKIFMIFQRLHPQESGYRGKGIGLAIAQRIVNNHQGLIFAKGSINGGSSFSIYFPSAVAEPDRSRA
jgi:signal transduction histidine kinase